MDYELIKILSKQKGLSIKELGDMVGMSDAGLYRAFINNTLKIDTLEKIAESLGVSPSYFFGAESNDKMQGLIERGLIINTSLYLKTLIIENIDIVGHALFEIWKTAPEKETKNFRVNPQNDEGIIFVDNETRLGYTLDFIRSKPKLKEQLNEAIKFASEEFAKIIRLDVGIEFLVSNSFLTSQDVVLDAINAFSDCFKQPPIWNERVIAAGIKARILLKIQGNVD